MDYKHFQKFFFCFLLFFPSNSAIDIKQMPRTEICYMSGLWIEVLMLVTVAYYKFWH